MLDVCPTKVTKIPQLFQQSFEVCDIAAAFNCKINEDIVKSSIRTPLESPSAE